MSLFPRRTSAPSGFILRDPADTAFLASLFEASEAATILFPISISGAIVEIWTGKSKTLVKGPAEAAVHGAAFPVEFGEIEGEFQSYETRYEIAKCEGLLVRGRF